MKVSMSACWGRCNECGCRYRAGELIVNLSDLTFHADCFRTRGALDLRPYEDQQNAELERLLAVIQAEEIINGKRR
jgi:hypothetical protein